ncbi:unnamed protein product [Linum trigynum]|uniref:GDSL esterase/lipase n=1 Tax=Linum trigynum TaxID=586398 RepID=A0AAV2FHU9_9ROSI
MVQRLNDQHGYVFVAAANSVAFSTEISNNPGAYGFTETRVACCGQSPYNGLGQCTPASNLCPNRDEYLYWDSTNPTDRAQRFFVEGILSGSATVVFPMNLNSMLAF